MINTGRLGGETMNTKDVDNYNIDQTEFERYLEKKEFERQNEKKKEEERKLEHKLQIEKSKIEQQNKQKALPDILITSAFNFEGYSIKKYSEYISADTIISVSTGLECDSRVSVEQGKQEVIGKLKEVAYDLGCNAVIGVDFDYITLRKGSNSIGESIFHLYDICITANGNAVIIERK